MFKIQHEFKISRDERLAEILADPVAAIRAVQRDHLLLGSHGFGEREPFHKGDHAENFRRNRAEMTDPYHVGQFVRAVEFLATRNNRSTLNRKRSSYGLKHEVESWHRRRLGESVDVYCSNGMFLAAALALGFLVEPMPWGLPNAWTSVGAPLTYWKRGRR